MMKYLLLAVTITAISAQDSSEADIDNFLDEAVELPCTPKPCVPICKPETKFLSFGAFKLPYTENVCKPDTKCLAANAACIKTLQAAMKDAAAKEAALKKAAAAKNKAGASKSAKDKAAAAKKAEAAAAKRALDLAKAEFVKSEKEAASAKAASVSADKRYKSKAAAMQKRLGTYEAEKKNHLNAVAAYDGAKSAAAKAAAAYKAAVNAHCTAEAQHAAAVKLIGHGHMAQKNCKKFDRKPLSKIKYIGSLTNPKAHPYVYSSRSSALAACKKSNYKRLCSKKEGEGYERCAAGWYSNYKGYWMSKTQRGCGSGRGFRGWGGRKVGAYCCGPQW